LAGVDGLRAAAALWVVLFHVRAFSHPHLGLPGVDLILRSGSTGVSLFLVLSGFCLFLPFAGGRDSRFSTRQFFWRRCRRLMPAYYASLLLTVLLVTVAGGLIGAPHFTPMQLAAQILTHVTLTHSLFPGTFYALDGAYWSLGLEWQLYLGLPLLIWCIGRFGFAPTVTASIGVNIAYRVGLGIAIGHGALASHSILADSVLPNQLAGRWAEFVYGMVAAELYVTGRLARWANRPRLLLLLLGPLSLLGVFSSGWQLSHLVYGLTFAVVLTLVLAENNVVSRMFAWPPLVAIGVMSYSLYLVHQPLIQGLAYALQTQGHLSPNLTFYALLACLPFIFLAAWILFVTVERLTLSSSSSPKQAEPHGSEEAAGTAVLVRYRMGIAPRVPRDSNSVGGLPSGARRESVTVLSGPPDPHHHPDLVPAAWFVTQGGVEACEWSRPYLHPAFTDR